MSPEAPAGACPFWSYLEQAESLVLDPFADEAEWPGYWDARRAYLKAFHWYLICRDSYTEKDKAEAVQRLDAVLAVVSARGVVLHALY